MLPSDPILMEFTQIILAIIFGMVLGIERVLAGRTAGPRTYGLVSLGACLITIISINALDVYPASAARLDPFPLVASVMTGVGFIGAGLIIFRGSKISGLTTAAGIWVSAAIGIAVGFGFTLLAFFATFITLFIFSVMWRFENLLVKYFVNASEEDHDDRHGV